MLLLLSVTPGSPPRDEAMAPELTFDLSVKEFRDVVGDMQGHQPYEHDAREYRQGCPCR